MKNTFTFFVAIVIVCVMLVYMFCFRVRYDQVAIVTTFGQAAASTAGDSGSVRMKPNLYFRWPWPFQQVNVYTKRVQMIEDTLQQQQTADQKNAIIRLFMAWKISDPRQFYLKDYKQIADAEPHLRDLLKDARGIISQYRFDQLVNSDVSQLKLEEIEEKARQQIEAKLSGGADGETGYGIEVVRVGIQRIKLPLTTTNRVFELMKESRQRLAQKARSEGKARADAIESKAISASQRILAFAERSAQSIRAEGDADAANYYGAFAAALEFAIFLRQVQALKTALSHKSTFVLNPPVMPALKMLFENPGSATSADQPQVAE